MSIEYAEDNELNAMVTHVLGEYTAMAPLLDNKIVILSVLKINLDNDGQNKPCKSLPVVTKKIGGAERVFIKDNAHFLLVMDNTAWSTSSEKQRECMVHFGLKLIKAEKDAEGNPKVSKNKPEVVMFYDTARYFPDIDDNMVTLNRYMMEGRKILRLVNNIKVEPEPEPEPEPEVVEPEPDLPPPRRVKRV